jgi:Ni/Fe-hydrogenase subunit HybB-like protein
MKELKGYLIGPTEPILFLACVIFAGLGILLVLLMGTRLRDRNSDHSPSGFSWRYLWSDNFKRVFASVLAVLITLRFITELTGWELSPWKAFVIGTFWDGIALWLKQKTNMLDPKPKV